MPIPPSREFHKPVLEVMTHGNSLSLKEIRELVRDKLKFTAEYLNEQNSKGSNLFQANVGYAVNNLFYAECLERTGRGTYRITPRGLKAIKDNPDRNNLESYLQRECPAYKKYRLGDEKAIGTSLSADFAIPFDVTAVNKTTGSGEPGFEISPILDHHQFFTMEASVRPNLKSQLEFTVRDCGSDLIKFLTSPTLESRETFLNYLSLLKQKRRRMFSAGQ